jgi:hypothetical protein
MEDLLVRLDSLLGARVLGAWFEEEGCDVKAKVRSMLYPSRRENLSIHALNEVCDKFFGRDVDKFVQKDQYYIKLKTLPATPQAKHAYLYPYNLILRDDDRDKRANIQIMNDQSIQIYKIPLDSKNSLIQCLCAFFLPNFQDKDEFIKSIPVPEPDSMQDDLIKTRDEIIANATENSPIFQQWNNQIQAYRTRYKTLCTRPQQPTQISSVDDFDQALLSAVAKLIKKLTPS